MKIRLAVCALAGAAALSACGSSSSPASSAGGVTITKPWVRATTTNMTAAYATIKSTNGDKLVKVSFDPAIAAEAQMHETVMTSSTDSTMAGMGADTTAPAAPSMTMRQVNEIVVPAGKVVELKPGGYHVMVMGVTKPLVKGSKVNMTLTFATAGAVTVSAEVTDAAP